MNNGLIQTLQDFLGHATTVVLGATVGRLMYYSGRREHIGWEVLYELPIAIGFAFIGESIGIYLEFSDTTIVGLIAALAYIGPRGIDAMFKKVIDSIVNRTKP